MPFTVHILQVQQYIGVETHLASVLMESVDPNSSLYSDLFLEGAQQLLRKSESSLQRRLYIEFL